MKRIIIQDTFPVAPFGEPARDLRILNKPLWLLQRDMLSRHCKGAQEVQSLDEIPDSSEDELFVHKDNLYFNEPLVNMFISEARATGHACQIAFRKDDRSITTHARHLQEGIRLVDDSYYLADMYYYPPGQHEKPQPLIIDTQPYEMGYYSVPRFMAPHGDLVFQIPFRAFLSIESWVHIFLANIPMGVFAYASQAEQDMDRCRLRTIKQWGGEEWTLFGKKLRMVLTSLWERINPFEEAWRNHFLSSKELVRVGKNCSIDPTAIIHGPTFIGDNVYIGPGVVIANSVIGNNVNIMQGNQIMLSVVSDRSFMAFNSALFMTSLMENCMVAQNTCLQLVVVGRNTFVGANSVFTDFDLEGNQIETYHRRKGDPEGHEVLTPVGLPVLGSAVGHNCKIGSGFVVYPGRMIGSNTTIVYSDPQGLIERNVVGGDLDDVNEYGEPRNLFYRWPHVYEPRRRRKRATEPQSADGRPADERPAGEQPTDGREAVVSEGDGAAPGTPYAQARDQEHQNHAESDKPHTPHENGGVGQTEHISDCKPSIKVS